jgi:hypothetical protein
MPRPRLATLSGVGAAISPRERGVTPARQASVGSPRRGSRRKIASPIKDMRSRCAASPGARFPSQTGEVRKAGLWVTGSPGGESQTGQEHAVNAGGIGRRL